MGENLPDAAAARDDGGCGSFVKAFLFGGTEPSPEGGGLCSRLIMDGRTEGWMGIPHGGIGMGAIAELAGALRAASRVRGTPYPLTVDFRLGGAGARSGDTMEVQVCPTAGGARGTISGRGDALPYLTAVLGYGSDESLRKTVFASYLPGRFSVPEAGGWIPLPYFPHCFVCGAERAHPGLASRFWLLAGPERIVVSRAGFDAGEGEPFYRFRRGGCVHPLPLLALLDETLGWAGFMATGSGAVTVRIGYTFYRDIRVGERLVFYGRNEKVKGNAGSRLFYWASGGAAVVDDRGGLEIVAAAAGQYLGVPALTEQMRRELIPPEWTRRAFARAGLS